MYIIIKRIIDLIISISALILFAPLFILVIVILKLTGEGEVFYSQNRIGQDSKYFNILKFATMLKDSPNIGTGNITLRDDPRVTKVGKILRKTKINELAQIFNVLKGDMSIVGPRPTVKKHADAYGEVMRDKIYSIQPGLTGIGSIIFRDEEDLISKSNVDPFIFYKNTIIPYKGKIELWYQSNRSTLLDLKIIFYTAWVILFPNSNVIYRLFKGLPERDF